MISYAEALNYIYNLNKYGIKLGLDNISHLLFLLGNPHKKLNILHIAGTNGKGSTAAIISSILQAEGFKVGLYTSPHLVDFTERMKINFQNISPQRVVELLEKVKPYTEEVSRTPGYNHPTFFEVITAMAFLYFYEEKVDFLVLEVGLGGRLDATNVCEPLVSVITPLDYDHMDKLGNSLKEIAREKGGIIKPGGIVITSPQEEEAGEEIKKIAEEKNALLFRVGKEINYRVVKSDIEGNVFDLKGISEEYKNMYVPLIGKHQVDNAATAIAAVEALRIKGLNISTKAIREGVEKARWEGRLEIIQDKPLLVLDGAHNPHGIRTVRQALEELFSYKRLILVLAIFSDKDYRKMIQIISPLADLLITSQTKNLRATPAELIAQEAAQYVQPNKIIVTKNISQAIKCALRKAQPADLICITGSLYTVGEAKRYFKSQGRVNQTSQYNLSTSAPGKRL